MPKTLESHKGWGSRVAGRLVTPEQEITLGSAARGCRQRVRFGCGELRCEEARRREGMATPAWLMVLPKATPRAMLLKLAPCAALGRFRLTAESSSAWHVAACPISAADRTLLVPGCLTLGEWQKSNANP